MQKALRTSLLLCVATAGSGILAQKVHEGGITALYGTDKGPWRDEKSDFDAILQSPNATGHVSVPGFPLPSPTAGSNFSGDWSWSLSVVADIPIPTGWERNNEFYTGGKLVFNGPFSPDNSSSDAIDDDWSVCLYEWTLWGSAYPNPLREDDGSCMSVLSTGCIAAMEEAAASEHTKYGCRCPLARDIPECTDDESALWSTTCAAVPFSASSIRAWGAKGYELRNFGDAYGHERGNATAYNYIGSLAWPVMASFRNQRTGGRITAKLSCPRADTAVDGSVAPTAKGLDQGDDQSQDGDDGQGDQQGAGDQTKANWLALGSLLGVAMIVV